jgi:hypothetical protein
MKTIFAIATTVLLTALPVCAQYIVYDPTMNMQQILDQAANIAKYAEMVNNQVQQIQQLTAQLQQLQQYNNAFGTPSLIVNVPGAGSVAMNLQQPVVGQPITALELNADGVGALTYNGNGLYVQIGTTFITPSGNRIQRNTNYYRPYDGVNKATENYTNIAASVLQQRQMLKTNIANTTLAIQSATNASEVQKLTGVLIGQSAALAATDKEVDQAGTLSLVQDIENRNDVEKQTTARNEEQKAEMAETFGNYRTNFPLLSQPPIFQETNQ